MKIQDIMTKNVTAIYPESSIAEIERLFSTKHFHALPVIDDLHKLAGIVTQYDLFLDSGEGIEYLPVYVQKLEKIVERGDAPESLRKTVTRFTQFTAKDIMTRKCLTLHPEDDVREAILIFQRTNFGTIPVLDDQDVLVGIVTLRDVVQRAVSANIHTAEGDLGIQSI